eukprot:scaffold1335_cov282-Chaetoceros_neogracile.AAC.18
MASFLENAAPVVAASKATIASGVGRMASAGFTSTKVVAGSVAAGMKSAIGSVSATGSSVTVSNMISNTRHFFGMGAAAAAPVVAASKATIASGVGRMASAGFTSTKVVAGSIAAGTKSAIGSLSATGSGVTVRNMIGNAAIFFGKRTATAAAPIVAVSTATMATGVGMTAAGFSSTGIAAGSIAAGIQSAIGNVAAGTGFAGVQSFGALGGFVGMSLVGFGSLLFSSLAGRW